LAVGGHLLGGGSPPDARLLLALGALALLAARPVSRATLRPVELLLWASAVQVAVHLALSWLSGAGPTSVTVPGHHGVETVVGAAHHAMIPSASMLVAHVAATVLTVALLVGADRAACRVTSWWRSLLVLATAGAARPAPRTHLVPGAARTVQGRRVGPDLPGRGPPRFALA
ncbi:hypothetical protein, partial [Actinotalea sp.]|uniref:hypothetical protein n=1 Tax=Actinotalea sp. TaxID=1872145 RepID=UPI00356B56A1